MAFLGELTSVVTLSLCHTRAFDDGITGSLEPSKLADLVVLAENPLTTPPERLHTIPVDLTILDGQIVYDRGAANA
jgi:predicted amidohydrolase YtcJ